MEEIELAAPAKRSRVAVVLPLVIIVLVGLATLGSGYALYHAKRPAVLTLTGERNKPDEAVHVRGPADAPVTLEEFGDFQCPPCGMLAKPIRMLEEQYSKDLKVIFHHFPLPTHQHSREAACAAEAAGLQGRFWEMHDLLFREQSEWSKASEVGPLFKTYAGQIGLDVEKFEQDVVGEKVNERVSEDQKQGNSIGVQNTPTIFLNNRAVEPANMAPEKLTETVAEEIKKKRS